MNSLGLLLLTILISHTSLAGETCNLSHFDVNLIGQYSSETKTLQHFTEMESDSFVKVILQNAKRDRYGYNDPCTDKSKNCVGHDTNWYYEWEKVYDSLGNLIRINGTITSNLYRTINNFSTQVSYTCAWDGKFKTECIKVCTATAIDDSGYGFMSSKK